MTRKQIAAAMAHHTCYPRDVTRFMLDLAIDIMTGAIARGEPIELRGFGRFSVRHVAAKTGFGFGNTPEPTVRIPARRVVRFRAHDHVLTALATGQAPELRPLEVLGRHR